MIRMRSANEKDEKWKIGEVKVFQGARLMENGEEWVKNEERSFIEIV